MTPIENKATSTENKALVQTIMEARSRRDHAPFIAAMADDFVWRIIGSTAWSGEYVGKAEVRERLLTQLAQNRGRFSIPQKSVRVRSKAYVARSTDLMM